MSQTPDLDALPAGVRATLEETGALLTGHFLLTSGRTSTHYLQAMRLLERPQRADAIARDVAAYVAGQPIAATLAPAIGGITWGYALAREFPGARALFAERVDGALALRRGFSIQPGELVLLAEDVTTTGGTVLELKALAEAHGARVAGIAAVVDRSDAGVDAGVPFHSWARLRIPTWERSDCPLCKAGSIPVKLGSRAIS